MSPLIPVALAALPNIVFLLTEPGADAPEAPIAAAVTAATTKTDAAEAQAVLDANPAAATTLRLSLAQMLADHQRVTEEQQFATIAEAVCVALQQRGQRPTTSRSVSVISLGVLISFGGVVAIVLLKGLPAGSETAANMLLGTLAAMATSVVSYWVGSSIGSARKDDRLMQVAKLGSAR